MEGLLQASPSITIPAHNSVAPVHHTTKDIARVKNGSSAKQKHGLSWEATERGELHVSY